MAKSGSDEERAETKASITKNLLIVGDVACGKTSLLYLYSKGRLPGPRICFEEYYVDIDIGSKRIELVLWEAPCEDHYSQIRTLSYENKDIILMSFSIGDPNSLKNVVDKWIPEVRQYCPNVPIVLVGNKKDLRNDPDTIEALAKMEQEPVKLEEGHNLADKIEALKYLECSATNKEGVFEVFKQAIRVMGF